MSLSKRFFLLAGILLITAFAFAFHSGVPSAYAASISTSPSSLSMAPSAVSPDFTCPERTICLFQNDDYSGDTFSCETTICRGEWDSTFVPLVGGSEIHAGSINDNSGSVVWVADKQAGVEDCLDPGRYPLDHDFGYFWVDYGVGSCANAPTPPMP